MRSKLVKRCQGHLLPPVHLDYWMGKCIHEIPDSTRSFPWRHSVILQRIMNSTGHYGVKKVGGK